MIMSMETVRVCKCDICGKILPKETGHLHWQANLRLGSNVNAGDSRTYEDICDECANAIHELIDKRSNKKEIHCEDKAYANEWL